MGHPLNADASHVSWWLPGRPRERPLGHQGLGPLRAETVAGKSTECLSDLDHFGALLGQSNLQINANQAYLNPMTNWRRKSCWSLVAIPYNYCITERMLILPLRYGHWQPDLARLPCEGLCSENVGDLLESKCEETQTKSGNKQQWWYNPEQFVGWLAGWLAARLVEKLRRPTSAYKFSTGWWSHTRWFDGSMP